MWFFCCFTRDGEIAIPHRVTAQGAAGHSERVMGNRGSAIFLLFSTRLLSDRGCTQGVGTLAMEPAVG